MPLAKNRAKRNGPQPPRRNTSLTRYTASSTPTARNAALTHAMRSTLSLVVPRSSCTPVWSRASASTNSTRISRLAVGKHGNAGDDKGANMHTATGTLCGQHRRADPCRNTRTSGTHVVNGQVQLCILVLQSCSVLKATRVLVRHSIAHRQHLLWLRNCTAGAAFRSPAL